MVLSVDLLIDFETRSVGVEFARTAQLAARSGIVDQCVCYVD